MKRTSDPVGRSDPAGSKHAAAVITVHPIARAFKYFDDKYLRGFYDGFLRAMAYTGTKRSYVGTQPVYAVVYFVYLPAVGLFMALTRSPISNLQYLPYDMGGHS
jgi:hypothetical protein